LSSDHLKSLSRLTQSINGFEIGEVRDASLRV
jgi:hypothetical protein